MWAANVSLLLWRRPLVVVFPLERIFCHRRWDLYYAGLMWSPFLITYLYEQCLGRLAVESVHNKTKCIMTRSNYVIISKTSFRAQWSILSGRPMWSILKEKESSLWPPTTFATILKLVINDLRDSQLLTRWDDSLTDLETNKWVCSSNSPNMTTYRKERRPNLISHPNQTPSFEWSEHMKSGQQNPTYLTLNPCVRLNCGNLYHNLKKNTMSTLIMNKECVSSSSWNYWEHWPQPLV